MWCGEGLIQRMQAFLLFFFFCVASIFSVVKTDTFSACRVILVFPQSTELWHGLQNLRCLTCLCDLFACVYTLGTLVYSLIWRAFVKSAQELTLEKSQSLARNDHPSRWWPCSVMLNFGFKSECSCSVPLTLSVGWCIPSVFDSSEKRQSCADLTICGGKGEPWQSKYVCVWPFVLKCTVFVYAQLWRQICSELLRYLFWSTQGLLGICWSLTMVSFEGTVDRSPSAYTGICFELHTFCHRQCSAGRIFFKLLNCLPWSAFFSLFL